AVTLVRTAASTTTSYLYGDLNWPAQPTVITRDSVLASGGVSVERFTYESVTGVALVHSVTGAIDPSGTQETHTTSTALYASGDPLCATDLTTTRTYMAGSGALASEGRPAGNLTGYLYDTRGRLQTLTRGTASTPLERIDYTYDATSGKKASETISTWQGGAW